MYIYVPHISGFSAARNRMQQKNKLHSPYGLYSLYGPDGLHICMDWVKKGDSGLFLPKKWDKDEEGAYKSGGTCHLPLIPSHPAE